MSEVRTDPENQSTVTTTANEDDSEPRRLLHECPLPELRAFVSFYGRIAHGPFVEQSRKILAWANDVELVR